MKKSGTEPTKRINDICDRASLEVWEYVRNHASSLDSRRHRDVVDAIVRDAVNKETRLTNREARKKRAAQYELAKLRKAVRKFRDAHKKWENGAPYGKTGELLNELFNSVY